MAQHGQELNFSRGRTFITRTNVVNFKLKFTLQKVLGNCKISQQKFSTFDGLLCADIHLLDSLDE